jgi:2-hydroxychromene-2-carboxylate isomerase
VKPALSPVTAHWEKQEEFLVAILRLDRRAFGLRRRRQTRRNVGGELAKRAMIGYIAKGGVAGSFFAAALQQRFALSVSRAL